MPSLLARKWDRASRVYDRQTRGDDYRFGAAKRQLFARMQGRCLMLATGTGGTGGEGQGKGGKPPEDPNAKSAFKSEKSKSALHAGKTLMQWKTQEVAEPGKAKIDYKGAMDKVKQGASEAILQEQIPPGYHEAIKKYFDIVDPPAKDGAKTPAPEPAKE